MAGGVKRFTDLRAWQACTLFKRAIYSLVREGVFGGDQFRKLQIEESVAGPPAHLAEGFGRFNPADFARYVVIARASLLETQNHLIDAHDRGYISDAQQQELNALAEAALMEVTGLMEYLQSPEALRNARRARERRITSRDERRHSEP